MSWGNRQFVSLGVSYLQLEHTYEIVMTVGKVWQEVFYMLGNFEREKS